MAMYHIVGQKYLMLIFIVTNSPKRVALLLHCDAHLP